MPKLSFGTVNGVQTPYGAYPDISRNYSESLGMISDI